MKETNKNIVGNTEVKLIKISDTTKKVIDYLSIINTHSVEDTDIRVDLYIEKIENTDNRILGENNNWNPLPDPTVYKYYYLKSLSIPYGDGIILEDEIRLDNTQFALYIKLHDVSDSVDVKLKY